MWHNKSVQIMPWYIISRSEAIFSSLVVKPAPKSAAEFGRFRRFVLPICWVSEFRRFVLPICRVSEFRRFILPTCWGFWDSRTPDWEVSL